MKRPILKAGRALKAKKTFHPGDFAFKLIVYILMAVFAVSFVFVMVWMVLNSFRTSFRFMQDPLNFFDFSNWTGDNYMNAFTQEVGANNTTMFGMVLNSVIYIFPPLILQIFIPTIAGYICAKFRFKGKTAIITMVIVSMTVPTVSSTLQTFRLISWMNLYDNFFGIYLMAAGGLGFGFLLYYNYFGGIPWEYAESAQLDGASNLRIFLQIYMPMARPIIVAMFITGLIGRWNDFTTPFLYLPSSPTVANGIQIIFDFSGQDWPLMFASMTFTCIVSLVLYALFSKQITESMSAGGLKA